MSAAGLFSYVKGDQLKLKRRIIADTHVPLQSLISLVLRVFNSLFRVTAEL